MCEEKIIHNENIVTYLCKICDVIVSEDVTSSANDNDYEDFSQISKVEESDDSSDNSYEDNRSDSDNDAVKPYEY